MRGGLGSNRLQRSLRAFEAVAATSTGSRCVLQALTRESRCGLGKPAADELEAIRARLARIGPWTYPVLTAMGERAGVVLPTSQQASGRKSVGSSSTYGS